MEWETIREHFAELLRDRQRAGGLTQETIAQAGGLSRQNQISRVLANRNRGPSVEIFIKAILGLGLTPSEFFAPLEGRALEPTAGPSRRAVPPDAARFAAAFAAGQAAFWRVLSSQPPRRRKAGRKRAGGR